MRCHFSCLQKTIVCYNTNTKCLYETYKCSTSPDARLLGRKRSTLIKRHVFIVHSSLEKNKTSCLYRKLLTFLRTQIDHSRCQMGIVERDHGEEMTDYWERTEDRRDIMWNFSSSWDTEMFKHTHTHIHDHLVTRLVWQKNKYNLSWGGILTFSQRCAYFCVSVVQHFNSPNKTRILACSSLSNTR